MNAAQVAPYLISLDRQGREVLSVDTDTDAEGWAAYFSPTVADLGALVLIRLATETPSAEPSAKPGVRVETALEVREVRVTTGHHAAGFASSLLREIPILRIEAAINQTAHRDRLVKHALEGASAAAELPGGTQFRTPPPKAPTPEERSLSIDDPGGYRKPNEFYRQVADLYLHVAAISTRPAHELAEANTIPVATVHRWIREAKARKILLLPAHRGAIEP